VYVTAAGASRLALFPALRHAGRKYTAAWEGRAWSLALVEDHLAEYVGVRRVGSGGGVALYHRSCSVGRQYAGHAVLVQYAPPAPAWVLSDTHGSERRRHDAPEIRRAEIVQLKLEKSGPRPRAGGRHPA
jgi:hypothetical protein